LYVEKNVSTQSLRCNKTNEVIGILAEATTTTGDHAFVLVYNKNKVAVKATIMPAMATKSVASPT
jgi:hypothetical protein